MLRIYIIGLAILITAIVANGIVVKLGIKSWYDFIELLMSDGTQALKLLRILDYLWLFIGYPFVLGFGYWIGEKLYTFMT